MEENKKNILQPIGDNQDALSRQATENEIIIYQPDSTVKLEVRLENDTVWLTQQQIADLFGVKQPAISKHLKNIFESGELIESSVHSILEYTATDGNLIGPNSITLMKSCLSVIGLTAGMRLYSANGPTRY